MSQALLYGHYQEEFHPYRLLLLLSWCSPAFHSSDVIVPTSNFLLFHMSIRISIMTVEQKVNDFSSDFYDNLRFNPGI